MENLSGRTIKGYELRDRIGAGGFGAVYKARQSTVGREVAVKIILPGFANHPDFIRRFVVTIDYQKRAVTFCDPSSFVRPADAEAFPLVVGSNGVFVTAGVSRIKGPLVSALLKIDTGSASAVSLTGGFLVNIRGGPGCEGDGRKNQQ